MLPVHTVPVLTAFCIFCASCVVLTLSETTSIPNIQMSLWCIYKCVFLESWHLGKQDPVWGELGKPPARTSCHSHHPEFILAPLPWCISHFESVWFAASLGRTVLCNFLWKEYFGSLNSEAFISEENLYWLLGWMSNARLEIFCPQHKEVSAQLPFSIFYVSAYRISLALFLKSVMPFWVDALLFLLGCCKFWEISLNCFYKSSTVLEGWLLSFILSIWIP